ncbi:MICOS complex subunit MIC60 [Psilocybe cubensis]|uniref:MICOS complex subunit MIC60 n=2 Tax=Psilocybe cubensis TaxID=181762 RepID=A0A8H7XY39_PSICU|nr:MICOS complex subunit MIC60 [Psilocybe cubensis]KAH9481317.1 MICOS complex subunit MIC60 [Psilocybe cubensis]
MYRALPVSRQAASTSNRQAVRVIRRHLATDTTTPPKKSKVLRRIILTTAGLTGTFYVGSAFLAFNNQAYYDIFSEQVPLGQSVLDFGESQGWDTLTVGDVINGTTGLVVTTYNFAKDMINGTTPEKNKAPVETKSAEPKSPFKVVKQTTSAKIEPAVQQVKKEVEEVKEAVKEAAVKVEDVAKEVTDKARIEYQDLVKRAEAAIAGASKDGNPPSVITIETTEEEEIPPPSSKNVYDRPLPLGFEPPPGFSRPAPPPKPKVTEAEAQTPVPEPEPVELPLVAPVVATASEPIITHLAGTIDNLASFLKSDPKAAQQAGDVLETAKGDLAALVDRMEAVKEQERAALEAKMDEQTREYSLKLLELEMEAQDKLDHQEEGFKQLFEQERASFVQAYREKLEHELKVQTELINERLKEEVIAQGIELQRRWIREIKVRVEQERGGRLAKLDELSANLKRLESIALINSAHLDENIRVHSLWSAIRALTNSAISSPVRKPFRDELRVLRHITAAREDPVVSVVLDSLESTDVPDVGVEPLADLATWFTNEVAPKVSQVALVPDENAGVLSYLASRALSGLRFKRQGLIPGDDVLSVLARAEYYLNEKNLDSAARELNQLKGPAKVLLHDWLEAARRRLEVQQALEVVQTQATLASLLVV